MGKTASKITQALGLSGNNITKSDTNASIPSGPNAPQWDTTIDQLFGDAPPDDNVLGPPEIPYAPPPRPKKRRRPPPPPPSMFNRGRKGAPSARGHHRGAPSIPEVPRRPATGRAHATNAPFGVNRRPIVVPAPIQERERPARVAVPTNFKRRSSSRRRK